MPRRDASKKWLEPAVRAEFIRSALTAAGIPYGLCHCGCGEKTPISDRTNLNRFRVAGEPIRYMKGHRRWGGGPQYKVDEQTGCWVWQRHISRDGYGAAWDPVKKQSVKAHRLYYERAKGPIPEGLHIDHVCQVQACVNPDHLEPVTALENLRRSRHARITMEDARAIRSSPLNGVQLAKQYGTSRSVISAIRRHRTWKEQPQSPGLRSFTEDLLAARRMRVPPGRERFLPLVLAAPAGEAA